MPPGPSLAPGSTPHPACLLTTDNGHTKYTYLFYQLGQLSSGSLSSETKSPQKLAWVVTWERQPGLWGCLPYMAMVIGRESGDTDGRRKELVLVLGAFTSKGCGRHSL